MQIVAEETLFEQQHESAMQLIHELGILGSIPLNRYILVDIPLKWEPDKISYVKGWVPEWVLLNTPMG